MAESWEETRGSPDYLATDQGNDDHGDTDDMAEIIETFEMYDLTPISGRLVPAA
jgi:hypothetical protein